MILGHFATSGRESFLRLCFFSGSANRQNPHSLVEPSGAVDTQRFQGFSTGRYCENMSLIYGWSGPRRKWWCRMQAWSAFQGPTLPTRWEIN